MNTDVTNQIIEQVPNPEEEFIPPEMPPKKDDDSFYNKIIAILISIVVVCIASVVFFYVIPHHFGSNSLSEYKLHRILKENGYSSSDVDNVDLIATIDLRDNVKGLTDKKNNKLVLIKTKNAYGYTIVNSKSEKHTDVVFGYVPLNAVMAEIWSSNKSINTQAFAFVGQYMNQYGINCFEDIDIAEQFLRQITGSNGVISYEKARNVVEASLGIIFPNVASIDEMKVLYEENNAVPLYYLAPATGLVYNWSIMSEQNYKILEATADSQTLNILKAQYGAPYVTKTVWAAVDRDCNEVGIFDSFEAAESSLLQK